MLMRSGGNRWPQLAALCIHKFKTMASAELVDIHSSSSDDDFEEPERKPIGWNYQLSAPKTTKDTPRPNGTATKAPSSAPASHRPKEEKPTVKAPTSPPVSSHSTNESDDDLEIIEVKVEPKSKLTGKIEPKKKPALLLSSYSRIEIRQQVRNATQSSIGDFFSSKRKASEDTNENANKKLASNTTEKEKSKKENKEEEEEEEEEEEDSDKSTARIEEFMRRWEEIKISKDDEKIRDKLWKHYHLAQTSYTHSKKFIHLVEVSTRKLAVDNIYVVIKNILDCLKQYKDVPYREKGSGEESAGTSREATPAPTEAESKINSRLRKVEKKMKELANKIKELENAEVDLEDEDNSSYLVEDRLKRQFSKLHDYYCRIANCSPAIGRPTERKLKFRGSKWMEINKRITAWVNKHKEFPDYVDILNLVKKVTKQSSLPLRPETVRVEAQEIFRDVGRMLKDRRESDDLYSIYSYMEDEEKEDPAKYDEALNSKLNENEKIASENLEKIFQEYVHKDAETRAPTQQSSSVKDPVRTGECQKEKNKTRDEGTVGCQKEESNETEGKECVKDDLKDKLQVIKNGSGNCIENDRNAENDNEEEEDEDITSESEEPVSDSKENSEDNDNESEDNDDSEDEVIEVDEGLDVKEQSTHEGTKVEELDDSDETDDDLKGVLASACIEEEEEDSEEDVPVVGSEELVLDLEGSSGETSSKNSVLCLDDDSQELTTTFTRQDYAEELSTTTTNVAALSDASIDTDTTINPLISSKTPQKRQQEENLSPCKRICL